MVLLTAGSRSEVLIVGFLIFVQGGISTYFFSWSLFVGGGGTLLVCSLYLWESYAVVFLLGLHESTNTWFG